MVERAAHLKGFRLRCEVSGKLMIHAPELQKGRFLMRARVGLGFWQDKAAAKAADESRASSKRTGLQTRRAKRRTKQNPESLIQQHPVITRQV
jgi:hypothetical protein